MSPVRCVNDVPVCTGEGFNFDPHPAFSASEKVFKCAIFLICGSVAFNCGEFAIGLEILDRRKVSNAVVGYVDLL